MYYVFEFLLVHSMVVNDSLQLIHQATGMEFVFDRLQFSLLFLVLKHQPRVFSSKFSISRLQQLRSTQLYGLQQCSLGGESERQYDF